MASEQPTPVIVMASPESNLVLRAVWFLFVGWWMSQLVLLLAWVLNVTGIGLPAGIWLINRIPQVATLKSSRKMMTVRTDPTTGVRVAEMVDAPQRPFWQRAIYFVFIGWWLSLLWLETAWLFGVLIVTPPIAFWMFGAAGKVTTPRR